MSKVKVGVVGYGTIGMRLADGVAKQQDMELVGVVDVGPTLAVRALAESGMAYDLYLVDMTAQSRLDDLGIPVTGSLDDLLGQVDIVLDATPGGIGARNKSLYKRRGQGRLPGRREERDRRRLFPRICQLREGPGPAIISNSHHATPPA